MSNRFSSFHKNGAEDNSPVMDMSICLAVFGFIELIVAIVAASYSCCCSQLYTSQVNDIGF
jgi:hypothetical protein